MSETWNTIYETTFRFYDELQQAADFEEFDPDGPVAEPRDMTDAEWLAAVAIGVWDDLVLEISEAVDLVHEERTLCLRAREHHLRPFQLAGSIVEKFLEY